MLIVWPKPYTINDLRSPQVGVGMTQLDRRKAVRIGVIDDEPFAPEDTLRQLGFDITYLGNIQTLAQIPRFRIILCDLKGVFPTSAKQGGALIKYVRDSHPTIYVLAYSGAHPSSALFRSAFDEADATIQKMADIDLWIDLLDEFVNKCVDPVEFWQRLRLYLISRNIEALQLMYLGQENDRHLLLKRLNDIRSIKYVASDISHHAYCDIAVHRVLRRLTSGLLQIPAVLNKKLKIKLEGESFSTIHGPDIFEFIPYLVLENAVKYSPSHDVITVTVTETDDLISCRVESNGPEIGSDEIASVFEKGFRGRHAKLVTSIGAGVGLFHAQTALRSLYNGRIAIRQRNDVAAIYISNIPYLRTSVVLTIPKT